MCERANSGERTRPACWRWRPRHRELFRLKLFGEAPKRAREAHALPRVKLHRDRRLDRRVRVVVQQFEVFELEIVNVFHRWIQFHPRQRSTIAGELFARLIEMVVVKMQVAERVDEIARGKIDNLRHHHREQRIRRDVERDAEKQIGAALVKLAA